MNDEVFIGIIIMAFLAMVAVVIVSLVVGKKVNRAKLDSKSSEPKQEPELVSDSKSKTMKKNETTDVQQNGEDVYASLLYYVNLDETTYGPFSLEQLKAFPLLEDTLITTNTLGGIWYEAKYFECLDELFRPNLPFRIDADGVIHREQNEVSISHEN